MTLDLELFREILADKSLHILLALVKRVAVTGDRSTCRVMASVLPEQREIVATMTWEAVGAEAGIFMLPEPGDLVLIGQAEGDKEQAFVLKRLTSSEELIPQNALTGDLVMKAVAGKNAWLTASRINLTHADGSPTENLVLGQQLKALLVTFMTAFENHTHIGNMGYSTSPPENKADVTSARTGKVENETILSNIAFTEKGS